MSTILTGDKYRELDGKLVEIKRQMRQPDGYPFDADQLNAFLQRAIEGRWAENAVGYFRRLGLSAVIPATTGQRTIADAKSLFTGYLDSDFENWGIGVPGEVRPNMPVESLELVHNGTFQDFFGSLGIDLNKLVMTDEQIIWVVENRPDLLTMTGAANFFLMKKGNQFSVACVYRCGGELEAYVYRLSDDDVWPAGRRHRFVVPQL